MNPFTRRILGNGSFPRIEGQELPDPVAKGKPEADANQAKRDKALGRKTKVTSDTPVLLTPKDET